MCRLVFVSVVRNPGLYARCVSSNVFNAGADFVCFDNTRDNVGVAGRYNSFLDSYDYSKPAWFVFCHEDWELLEDIRPKLAGLPEDSLYGPIGNATLVTDSRICSYTRGFCRQCDREGKRRVRCRGLFRTGEVDTFDCQCLIVHSSLVERFSLRFDENFTFDLYVEDFCISAFENHGVISRILPMDCRHWSYGSVSDRFMRLKEYLSSKCRGVHSTIAGKSLIARPELVAGRRFTVFARFFLNHPEKYWLIARYGHRQMPYGAGRRQG